MGEFHEIAMAEKGGDAGNGEDIDEEDSERKEEERVRRQLVFTSALYVYIYLRKRLNNSTRKLKQKLE